MLYKINYTIVQHGHKQVTKLSCCEQRLGVAAAPLNTCVCPYPPRGSGVDTEGDIRAIKLTSVPSQDRYTGDCH